MDGCACGGRRSHAGRDGDGQDNQVQQEIQKYRQMLQEGNPAELSEARGEELWATPRGPNQATLEQCDLGLGPGKLEGAYAQLPRYFTDTGKVQDVESRLVTCMTALQGLSATQTPRRTGTKPIRTWSRW